MPWRRLLKSHALQSKTNFENVYHNSISKLFHGWNPLKSNWNRSLFSTIHCSNFNVQRHGKICQIEVTSINNCSILISIWHWSMPHFPPRYMKNCQMPTRIGVLFSQNPQETTGWESTMVYFIFSLIHYKYHHGNVFNIEAIDVITRRLLLNVIAWKLKLRINWNPILQDNLASILFIRCNQATQDDGDNDMCKQANSNFIP